MMKNKKLFLIVLMLFTMLNVNSLICQQSREINKSFSLNNDGRLTIDTYKGSINIETWEKEKVQVEVKIEADGWDKYDEEKVKDTEIIFDSSPNTLTIKTDYDKIKSRSSSFWSRFSKNVGSLPLVHYQITMPRTAELRIEDYKSDSKISNLNAHIDFETYKGEVVIRNLTGSIDIETYKGDVRVEFLDMSDRSRFETYKGDITVELPETAKFDFNASIGKKADFDSDFGFEIKQKGNRKKDRRIEGRINGGGPELYIENEKGEIQIRKK